LVAGAAAISISLVTTARATLNYQRAGYIESGVQALNFLAFFNFFSFFEARLLVAPVAYKMDEIDSSHHFIHVFLEKIGITPY
jgi:hypothetical protein